MTDRYKLKQLEEKLARYKKILDEKRRNFRGVRHESSLSELRYTELMVYTNLVQELEKEIKEIRSLS